jgi:DOMON domain
VVLVLRWAILTHIYCESFDITSESLSTCPIRRTNHEKRILHPRERDQTRVEKTKHPPLMYSWRKRHRAIGTLTDTFSLFFFSSVLFVSLRVSSRERAEDIGKVLHGQHRIIPEIRPKKMMQMTPIHSWCLFVLFIVVMTFRVDAQPTVAFSPTFAALFPSPSTPVAPAVNSTVAPTVAPAVPTTVAPVVPITNDTALDCSFPAPLDVLGDGSVLVSHIIDPIQETVTVRMEYMGEAWVSFGFSNSIYMIPNVAVIGLPNEGTVRKYNMTNRDLAGVFELPASQQTLMNTSITQVNGVTTLQYTHYLQQPDEVTVQEGQNTFIWAFGLSNPLASHDTVSRGGRTTNVATCLAVGETPAPVPPPTPSPTVAPVTSRPVAAPKPTPAVITGDGYDCSFRNPVDILGDSTLMLKQIIHPVNKTVTVELEYVGTAWVSFGFSTTAAMVPNVAVIGLPDEGTVLKYDMTSKDISGVTPLADAKQTLMATSITQNGGITTLRFTQFLDEEVTVTPGKSNMYLWAYGTSNAFAAHTPTARGDATAIFTECLKVGETAAPTATVTKTPTASPLPATAPGGGGIIDLGQGRVQRSVSIAGKGIDLTFITDEPQQLLTVEMVYAGQGYVSVAFSADPLMPDSLAVIALPGGAAGVPQKYDMGAAKTVGGVVLSADIRQTLMDAMQYQNDTHTGMIFTKKWVEPNEQEIFLSGENHILWAIGPDNSFGLHSDRGAFVIDFSSTVAVGSVDAGSGSPNKGWWIAHGLMMAVSWAILVPIAISTAILKSYLAVMPAGYWFRTHRNLNALAVFLTIFGFAISVYLISDEQGSSAVHFQSTTHHKVGLVVFLFAFLQALSGFVRPHLPHKPDPVVDDDDDDDDLDVDVDPEETAIRKEKAPVENHPLKKSPQRIFFEYQHRLLGAITVVMGWFNCDSGFDAYNLRFQGPELNAALWAVVCTISLFTAVLFIYDRFGRPRN